MAKREVAVNDREAQTEGLAITKKRFARELAAVVQEELGTEISIETSWELFKSVFRETVDLALEKPASLAGIGIFDVQKCHPRGPKVGVVAFAPKFRLRTSTAVDEYLERKLGVLIPGEEQEGKAK